LDRTAELQTRAPLHWIAWVVGREYLHPWPDLRALADRDLHHVEDHAVEIQEHVRAQTDVEAVVAVERRSDYSALADSGEAFQQQFAPVRGVHVERGVIAREPSMCRPQLRLDFRCAGVVQLAGQHLLPFRARHAVLVCEPTESWQRCCRLSAMGSICRVLSLTPRRWRPVALFENADRGFPQAYTVGDTDIAGIDMRE